MTMPKSGAEAIPLITGGNREVINVSPPYVEPHWSVFIESTAEQQGPVGSIPSEWAQRFRLIEIPDFEALPSRKLCRGEIRAICVDPSKPVLFGYICAMAWGGQGGAWTKNHPRSAWEQRKQLESHLARLRAGGLTREDAYNMFCGNGAIYCLGPSFFTKLLYFFSLETTLYIMDQWTAKSINCLTGKTLVKISGDSPSRENTGLTYRCFCEEIDRIAMLTGCTGEEAEERLFSKGGRQWRDYVKKLGTKVAVQAALDVNDEPIQR
jgi:hypothetical protein